MSDEASAAENALKTASSIATFESTETECYRQQTQVHLARLVTRCRQQTQNNDNSAEDTIIHYDSDPLAFSLLKGFEWTPQCQYHDSRKWTDGANTQTATDSSSVAASSTSSCTATDLCTSPLNELVKLLLDPRVIPLALASSIVQTLVQAFLRIRPTTNCTSGEWSRSQLLVLNSIASLMKVARQCRDNLGSIIYQAVQNEWANRLPPLPAAKSLLSLLKYCAKELEGRRKFAVGRIRKDFYFPIPHLFPFLLVLLQAIVSPKHGLIADEQQLQQAKNSKIVVCGGCNKYVDLTLVRASKRKRTRHCMDMETLHETALSTTLPPRHFKRPRRTVSVKSIMEAKERNPQTVPCPYCPSLITTSTIPPSVGKTTNIESKQWQRLGAKFFDTMISWFQSQSKQRAFGILRDTLTMTTFHCPFRRLCTLQLAQTAGRDGYGYLFWSLWNLTWEQANPNYLKWYAEVIVESSFCDDRESCWDAMQPLINSIRDRYMINTMEDHQQPTTSSKSQSQATEKQELPNKLLLPCLEYILTRRRNLFLVVDDSIKEEFEALVQGVSATLENSSTASMEKTDTTANRLDHASDRQTEASRWVDPDPLELRRAFQRMQWCLLNDDRLETLDSKLLSELDHDDGLGAKLRVAPWKNCPPLMHLLSDDLLRIVLSYAGYKKLVKLRLVCKTWRNLADEDRLWFPLYRTRFGLLSDGTFGRRPDGRRVTVNLKTWREHFMDKWIAQRAIKLDYSRPRSGESIFKHRVCRYLGCLCVLKTAAELKAHSAIHKAQARGARHTKNGRKTKQK